MAYPQNPIRRFFHRFFTRTFAFIGVMVLSIYQATLKFEIIGDENLLLLKAQKKNYILAVWHTFVDTAALFLHSSGYCVYTDHPRTEKYTNSWSHFSREVGIQISLGLGYKIVDASMGKQSVGIINYIKTIKNGIPALIAPDGPAGPIYKAKPGAVYMAKKANAVVLPIGIGLSKKIIGPNWDDFAFPLPFSKVVLIYGKPIEIDKGASDETMEEKRVHLEETLDSLCHQANAVIFKKNLVNLNDNN